MSQVKLIEFHRQKRETILLRISRVFRLLFVFVTLSLRFDLFFIKEIIFQILANM